MVRKIVYFIFFLFLISFTSAFNFGETTVSTNNIYIINESEVYHNNMSGLQGGVNGEYYHIRQTWYDELLSDIFDWITQSEGDARYILQSSESILNVNSSNYWDGLNSPSDLNNLITLDWANITNKVTSDFNYLILSKWANITDAPTALSFFTDDLGNRGYTHLTNFTNDLGIGNWTLDKPNYYTSIQVDALTLSHFTNDLGIGNWTADKGSYYTSTQTDTQITNANTSMKNYVDGTFVVNSGGDNLTGQYDYNGGWTSNGLSIIDGDLYAQTVYAVNFSGLNVNTVSTNGSLYPTMDNQFDLGNQTYRWRDLNLGRNAYIGGNVGIGTNNPNANLEIKTSGRFPLKVLNSTGANIFTIDDTYNKINMWRSVDLNLNPIYGDMGSQGDIALNPSGGKVGIGTTLPQGKLHVGDQSTNYFKVADDGEVTLVGTARVKKQHWIGADALREPGAKPASFVAHGLKGAWEFADAASGSEEQISGTFKIPTDMDISVVPTFNIGWSAAGSSPGNSKWQLEYLWIAGNEDTTAAAQETLTTISTASATSNGLVIASFSGIDLPTSSDKALFWRITRLSASGDDTISDVVHLHGIYIEYTANKLGEGLV